MNTILLNIALYYIQSQSIFEQKQFYAKFRIETTGMKINGSFKTDLKNSDSVSPPFGISSAPFFEMRLE